MTRLCVAIFVTDLVQAQREIALAAENGADLVELRVDTIQDRAVIEQLVRLATIPVILTCRPTWEGGQSTLTDIERGVLLTSAIDAGANFVDIELETLRRHESSIRQIFASRAVPTDSRLVVSSHKFSKGRPSRLNNIMIELYESPCDVAKVVWAAGTVRDNLEAFEILQHRQKPTIALCMGEAGLISRILAKKFGAFLTFAALDGSTGTAPGQISITDMKRLYRWDAIQADTKVFGVVGSPIGHSMSPAIHNSAFDHINFNGVYLPLLVNPGYESFKAFMESFVPFKGLDLSGLSITIPHKENALRYLQEIGGEVERLAEQIGAVNTIDIRDGKLRGFNTDYAAILDSITNKLNITRDDLKDHDVAVIGAGGTGRTAVAALAAFGARVTIYNRTRDKADALANEFKVTSADFDSLRTAGHQIYINTTSIGMHPNVDESPMDSVPADSLVFDAVYNPMKTKLLVIAEAEGAKTIGGIEMFVRQAGGQFSVWTGQPAPLDLMRGVVESRLSK